MKTGKRFATLGWLLSRRIAEMFCDERRRMMARKQSALVVTLDEAAEAILSTTSFIRREIRDGAIKAIRLGSKTVIRKDELKAYLERKEAEGLPAKKSRANCKAKTPGSAESEVISQEEGDASLDSEPEIVFEEDAACNQKEKADEDE